MGQEAKQLDADAVIDIDLYYETITFEKGGCMLMVVASWTAIKLGSQ